MRILAALGVVALCLIGLLFVAVLLLAPAASEQGAYDLGYSLGYGLADLFTRPSSPVPALLILGALWLVTRPLARRKR